jgi:hypothetical protein
MNSYKCIANFLGECSSKISKEHFISKCILDWLSEDNSAEVFNLAGSKNFSKKVGKNSLVAKILCEKHNSELSFLDNEMLFFLKSLKQIDQEFIKGNTNQTNLSFSSENIEKWILKLSIAIAHIKKYKIREEAISFLFDKKPLPHYWGLYLSWEENKNYFRSHLDFTPLTNPKDNTLMASLMRIGALKYYLLMGKPDNFSSFGVYHPKGIIFRSPFAIKRINFNWGSTKRSNSYIIQDFSGSYEGKPPDWPIK